MLVLCTLVPCVLEMRVLTVWQPALVLTPGIVVEVPVVQSTIALLHIADDMSIVRVQTCRYSK